MMNNINSFLELLRCPTTKESVRLEGDKICNQRSKYDVTEDGIIMFSADKMLLTPDSSSQQEHYDKIQGQYIENIKSPHTTEYSDYISSKFKAVMSENSSQDNLGNVAEICCGQGELLNLTTKFSKGVGVDISIKMLSEARKSFPNENYLLVQGDAVNLPLVSESFDNVFIFGGVHHVSDTKKLFSEISRILKPGGIFYFREPADDFFLWRFIRKIIYKLSPLLDHNTEKPLVAKEIIPDLEEAGFEVVKYEYVGFLGFCIFMNSDVLIFNRLFKFIPGIRSIVRIFAKMDDYLLRIPLSQRLGLGLQVIGSARKL